MSRAFPLPGAAARSPRAAEMDPRAPRAAAVTRPPAATRLATQPGAKTRAERLQTTTQQNLRASGAASVRGRPSGCRMRDSR
jgi:hypothetical protein